MSRFSAGHGLRSHGLPSFPVTIEACNFPGGTAGRHRRAGPGACLRELWRGPSGFDLEHGGVAPAAAGAGPGAVQWLGGSGSAGPAVGAATQSACSAMSAGQGASLNGFRPFGSDNLWNKDISASPVDPNSDAIINFIGSSVGMHADFGSGEYQGSNIGIPYSVVGGSQTPVGITFTAYGAESDPGPMPVPATRRSRAIPIPAMAIATCWCSITAIVFSTKCSAPSPTAMGAGMQLRRQFGTC